MKQLRLILIVLLVLAAAGGTRGFAAESCLGCHRAGSSASRLTLDAVAYRESVHGLEGLACVDCHRAAGDERHMTTPGSGRVDCTSCHDVVNLHGEAAIETRQRPACFACHGRHRVFAAEDERSSLHGRNLANTCGVCHPAAVGASGCLPFLASLRVSSHKKGDFSRPFGRCDCLGCHQGKGAHGIPVRINDRDCSTCHLSLEGEPLLAGAIHPAGREETTAVARMIHAIYLSALAALLLAGLAWCRTRWAAGRNETGR
ncbi:MAG: hypothetical protein JW781_06995 [Deltaproteobacteria bacterium]|nr:hypothetical protein [Candidatus Anaeroferrophillacea bacterium]